MNKSANITSYLRITADALSSLSVGFENAAKVIKSSSRSLHFRRGSMKYPLKAKDIVNCRHLYTK